MDELQSRLERLAPPVDDVDDALGHVHAVGRQRRLRRRGGALAAVVVVAVVLLSATMLTGGGVEGADVVAANPDRFTPSTADRSGTSAPGTSVADAAVTPPSTADSTTTTGLASVGPATRPPVSSGPDPSGSNGSGSDPSVSETPPVEPVASDVQVSITPEHPSVAFGERLHVRVEMVNNGPSDVLLYGGGCGAFLFWIEDAPGFGTYDVPGPSWDGAPSSFGRFVQEPRIEPPPYLAPRSWGAGWATCPAVAVPRTLAVGERISEDYIWDAMVLPGVAVPPSSITLGAFVLTDRPDGTVPPGAETTVGLTGGGAVSSANLQAFADSVDHQGGGMVDAWIAANRSGDPDVDVRLGYRRGAIVAVLMVADRQLWIVGDPITGAITRMTSMRHGAAPSDDPDASPELKDPGEVVIFLA